MVTMMAVKILELFVRKLERRQDLPDRERAALLSLSGDVRQYAPGETLIAPGQAATHCVVLGEGLLSRQKTLTNGTRQLLAVHLAGDAVDLQSIFFREADHAIRSHSAAATLWIDYDQIVELCDAYPTINKSLWLDCLADASIFREWTANNGQRNARERIAHLLAELGARNEAIGELQENTFNLPLNQQDMADALGLSLVHLNKSLKTLRNAKLIQTQGRNVTLSNRQGLEQLAGFNPDYLYIDGDRVKKFGHAAAGAPEMADAEAG